MILLRRVIGDALRARRQAQHRTLREVSMAANVSLGYLSEIERGQKEASSELLAAVCDALGARLSELLNEISSTVASTEQHEESTNPLPEQREAATVTATSPEESRQAEPATVSAVAAEHHRPTGQGPTEHRPAEHRPAERGSVERGSDPVTPTVSTLVDGDVSVTVRQDGPLSATLRARTIRRDVVSVA